TSSVTLTSASSPSSRPQPSPFALNLKHSPYACRSRSRVHRSPGPRRVFLHCMPVAS
ncbi:hypothetical protein Csa_023011, partial [Cucumis sativus]